MSLAQENEEFPILCETCLGENPMVRMTKQNYAKACKICDRPFTVYRWKPGPNARYKKTELCRTCAKLKNVCQTCVLDLEYGLPVQVRDSVIAEEERVTLPQSDIGRAYMIEQFEKKMAAGIIGGTTTTTTATIDNGTQNTSSSSSSSSSSVDSILSISYNKLTSDNKLLTRLHRPSPYYKRNEAHLCSFFARGECNRGSLCPFRHEMPTGGDLAKQNIRDRYMGHNDPVAMKMLGKVKGGGGSNYDPTILTPPIDPSITTLFLSGVDENVTEQQLLQLFYPYGELKNIHILSIKHCAFITYQNRVAAEEASRKMGQTCAEHGWRLSWGRSRGEKQMKEGETEQQLPESTGSFITASSSSTTPIPLPPGMKVLPSAIVFSTIPPPPGMSSISYPSQHPSQTSAKFNT